MAKTKVRPLAGFYTILKNPLLLFNAMKALIAFLCLALILPAMAAAQETLNVEVMSCTELECINQKDTFLVGESAYIDYNASVKGISYSALITFPDGQIYQTAFPNRIISNVTGNYTVDIIAWKDDQEARASHTIQFVESLPEPAAAQEPARLDWLPVILILGTFAVMLAVWKFPKRKPSRKEPKKKR
jgi:hypothetical protein